MLRQNSGRLSKRAREREFAQLTDEEAVSIEQLYGTIFSADELGRGRNEILIEARRAGARTPGRGP